MICYLLNTYTIKCCLKINIYNKEKYENIVYQSDCNPDQLACICETQKVQIFTHQKLP